MATSSVCETCGTPVTDRDSRWIHVDVIDGRERVALFCSSDCVLDYLDSA